MISAQPGLLAWIEPHSEYEFSASFVGADAHTRQPATFICDSAEAAQSWIEAEAEKLGLPVIWIVQRD